MSVTPVRLRRVALIVNAAEAYYRKVVQGVADYTREKADWNIYLEENVLDKLPDLSRWKAEGVIADFDDPRVVHALQACHLPVVAVGGRSRWYDPASGIPYIASDDDAIARLACEHFLERGISSLGFCGFRPTKTNLWSQTREKAFREHVAKAGLSCSVHLGRQSMARSWDIAQRNLADWLVTLCKPVGVMACDDVQARHVLESCRLAGLRVSR